MAAAAWRPIAASGAGRRSASIRIATPQTPAKIPPTKGLRAVAPASATPWMTIAASGDAAPAATAAVSATRPRA